MVNGQQDTTDLPMTVHWPKLRRNPRTQHPGQAHLGQRPRDRDL